MKDKVVISLSSIPPRFKNLGNTLKCLLNQEYHADEIQVFIPRTYRRFPQHAFSTPEVPQGVTLKIVDKDLGPATKVLYCAKAHWGTRTRIIYCDDDLLPDRDWLNSFILASNSKSNSAIASRGLHLKQLGVRVIQTKRFPRAKKSHKNLAENLGYVSKRISQKTKEVIFRKSIQKPQKSGELQFNQSGYVDIAEGCGGVSIKPEFFDCSAFEIPQIMWTVDDIWLSGLLEYQNIGIWLENSIQIPFPSSSAGVEELYNYSTDGFNRKSANKYGIRYMQDMFSIWK